MSILAPMNVSRKSKSTRPAAIRRTPRRFGLGVLDDAAPDVCRMSDAEFERHLYGDLERRDPGLALEVRAAEARAAARNRSNVTPSTLDQAENLGYELGRLGVEANASCVYNHKERAAFVLGHQRGLSEYHRDEIAATEAWLAEREYLYDGSDEPWDAAECNVGGLVGHEG